MPKGSLASDVATVSVLPTDTGFDLTLRGSGDVRFRVESSEGWIVPAAERGVFTGSGTLHFATDPSAASADGTSSVIRVFSDQGNVSVVASTKPTLSGVWAGSISFTGVNPNGATPSSLTLGSAHFGLAVRDDGPGLRARIDPAASTFWAAGATGAAAGTGVANPDGTVTFTIDQLIDSLSAAPLADGSPSVFGQRPVGRRLKLVVAVADDGRLSGTASETIYGLTSTPVEIDGTIAMRRNANATPPAFDPPAAVTMPAGPARDAGQAPKDCPGTTFAACNGTTTTDKWTCITGSGAPGSGLLEDGYPLNPFFLEDMSVGGTFGVPPQAGTGPSPYETASEACASDLGTGDWRKPMPIGPAAHGCANTGLIDCARYRAATTLVGINDSLASQGAQYATRAYLELFSLIGNERGVKALADRLGTSATAAELIADRSSARAALDTGLAYLFDPRLFEELRATTASDAQVGPLLALNDRVALRRAAETLRRSAAQTSGLLDLMLSTAADPPALHARAQADATLYWLEIALLADLDARWRGATDALPEVVALGDVAQAYDTRITNITADANPLGIPNRYVPLLSKGVGSPTQTNFERLQTIAGTSLATSVAADAKAAADVRSYDDEVAAASKALGDQQTAYLSTITAICGNGFVVNGAPKDDLSQCGVATGSAATARNALQAAKLQLLAANQALQAQYDLYKAQSDAFARIHGVNGDLVEMVTESNKKIFDLSVAQSSCRAAAYIAQGLADGIDDMQEMKYAGGSLKILAGTLNAAAELMQPFIDQQRDMQALAQVRAGAVITDIENELSLKETALQFAGLRTQVAIAANQIGGAVAELATQLEQVQAATTGLAEAAQGASRDIATDPSFRVIQGANALQAEASLRQAKRDMYLAARALEYETNTRVPALTSAIFAAQSAASLSSLGACLSNAWTEWRLLVSSTNQYVTEVSLAKDVLGIKGAVTDPQTKETLSPGEQFRRYLFAQPYSPDSLRVWPALSFGTTLDDKGSLFSSLLCNDRIETIEAKVVGAGLAGSTAEVQVLASGASTLRGCAPDGGGKPPISVWNLRPAGALAPAVVQSGVNAYPAGVAANQSLTDYAVAQSRWVVALPDANTSPANAALDVTKVDDIVLRVTHTGVAVGSALSSFNPTCN